MTPRVSIGLPVYNGDRYLRETIEGLLNQTFSDFELVICDNASTDRTQDICNEYCLLDKRVRYYRNNENIGAGKNFNKAFSLSQGQYFKWAACDDICKPSFLKRCVTILDRDQDIVLCHPQTIVIDDVGKELEYHKMSLPLNSPLPSARFKASLRNYKCYQVFGLIRRATLLKTPLIGNYAHADGVLLARLALLGRFKEVPEYLFCVRRHPGQSTHMWVDYKSYIEWYNPDLRGKILSPYFRMHFEYFRSLRMVPLKLSERLRCSKYLTQFTYGRRKIFKQEASFFIENKCFGIWGRSRCDKFLIF